MSIDTSLFSVAPKLARNPLGIIALFIVLVYAMASAVTATSGAAPQAERLPLIYFLVFFPVLVLAVFGWLVSCHPLSLYAPSDFRKDEHYIAAAKLSAAKAAAALTAASFSSGGSISPEEAASIAVSSVKEASYSASKSRSCVLWVDDRPENNINLRDAFLEFGIDVQIALSTEQALASLEGSQFDAIISDMGRKEGPQEGYVLLDEVRKRQLKMPFFIYAGSNSPEHKAQAEARGAQGSTNNANELFREVTKAIWRGVGSRG